MSNNSAGSSSVSRGGRRVQGIPRMCWCGDAVTEFVSKTDTNPGRRFYRCRFAADRKLKSDGSHVFKWVDEALLEEREMVEGKAKTLEEEVKLMNEIIMESLENGKKQLEKMEIDLEERFMIKIEDAMLDVKSSLRKSMCFLVVIGFITVIGFSKFFDV